MKLLVTGVEGYLGCLLAPFLQERGHHVIGVDTGYYRDGWLFSDCRLVPVLPTIANRDVRRLDLDDLVGIDAVVHLAELADCAAARANPDLTFEINHQAAVRLAGLAKAAGVKRFVYSSCCSVYGPGDGKRVLDERAQVNPQGPYATCKVLVERDVAQMASSSFSPTFLRKPITYGASPRMRFDTLLNNLVGSAATTGRALMPGSDGIRRAFLHVQDLCEAVACTLEAPRDAVHAQVFNVGQQCDNYQLGEIGSLLHQLYPDCVLRIDQDGQMQNGRLSFAKIRDQLFDFRCCWDVPRGMRHLRDVFERIKLDEQTFRARHFTRLKQLSYLNESGQIDEKFYWMY
jgi:nucleoside-diphosphate-sugar epimerase